MQTKASDTKIIEDHLYHTGKCIRGHKQQTASENLFVAISDIFDHLAESQELARQNEQMLIAEQRRLKALGDNFPNGCLFRCQIDAAQLRQSGAEQTWLNHLTLTYASAAWEKLTNVSLAESMLDISVPFKKIHPDDLAIIQPLIFRKLLEAADFDEDIRYYSTDTDLKWIQLSSRSKVENGTVICDGFILDITERKLAEKKLVSRREELERLVNKRTEELETANEELLAANEELFSINEEFSVINEELRYSNERLYHEISTHEGTIQKLEESEEKLRNFIEQSFEGIMILDKDGRVVEWNRSLEQISGISRSEAIGQHEWELLKNFLSAEARTPEAFNRLYRSRIEYLEGGSRQEPVVEELTLHMPNERKCYVRVSIFPVGLNKTCLFGRILRDVTEQKMVDIELTQYRTLLEQMVEVKTRELTYAKEKAEESDKLKSAFLANMSHEIRTPLNGIVNFLNILTSHDLTPEIQQESINIVNNCSRQLVQLIDDIIDIAKIETGQLNIRPIPFQINTLMNELLVFFESQLQTAQKERIVLVLDNSGFIEPCTTMVDPLRLRQVLNNLISNAIKFTEYGYIRFGYHQKADTLEFIVEDTGIGLTPDQQEIIFERFRQAQLGNNRNYGGSGLGLTISRNLAQMMNGNIGVKSTEGIGSTFYFTIPYLPVSENH